MRRRDKMVWDIQYQAVYSIVWTRAKYAMNHHHHYCRPSVLYSSHQPGILFEHWFLPITSAWLGNIISHRHLKLPKIRWVNMNVNDMLRHNVKALVPSHQCWKRSLHLVHQAFSFTLHHYSSMQDWVWLLFYGIQIHDCVCVCAEAILSVWDPGLRNGKAKCFYDL
jgi:hypothetical protein